MRIAVVLVILTVVLVGLIAWRLRAQAAVRHALSGGFGEIEGADLDLSTRVAARVARILVKRGNTVRKSDLLLELDCTDPQAAFAETVARSRAEQASFATPATRDSGKQASFSLASARRTHEHGERPGEGAHAELRRLHGRGPA